MASGDTQRPETGSKSPAALDDNATTVAAEVDYCADCTKGNNAHPLLIYTSVPARLEVLTYARVFDPHPVRSGRGGRVAKIHLDESFACKI